MLPAPPTSREKYSYVRPRAWVLTLCSAISFPLLWYAQFLMMEKYPWFWLYLPVMTLGIAFYMLPLFTDRVGHGLDLEKHRGLVETWRPLRYPSVDVFLPVCGEPIEVLRNTWSYVAAWAGITAGRSTPMSSTIPATPSSRPWRAVRLRLCDPPNRGWLKKSGNLLYGFKVSSGEYILLLDADFAPRRDLLDETLPYMAAYPSVGIVQTPQFFRVAEQQTWVERGAGAVQELFYRSIQTRAGEEGRRDLRRQLRDLPPGSAPAQRGHVARRALRGHADRLRPAARMGGACSTCRSSCPPGTARTTSSPS